MRIAVNTRLLLKDKLEGIGWFSAETLKIMCRKHPEHQFIFIFDRDFDDDFIFSKNVKPVVLPPRTRHPVLWWFWLEWRIPHILKKYKADIFISPDGFLSLRSKVPSLPVIHDINFEHHPEQLPFFVRHFYKKFFPEYAKKALRVGTVSEYSKNDIAKSYGIDKNKIDVFYNGANKLYLPPSEGKAASVREEISKGKPYFVFVGALNPRKNIPGLLKAFEEFKEADKKGYKLVIVGNAMHKTKAINSQLSSMNYINDVIFTGRLEAEKLSGVLGSAEAMVFVPFFEGFGIPIVEAMYAETPVICSNRTSMPEVAGDAALLVDPENTKEISDAMKRISSDKSLKKSLIEKSIEQRKKFSWEKSADKFWKSIEKCIESVKQ